MNLEIQDSFDAAVPVIDDGDVCGNFEHKATAQALANRTEHTKNRAQPVYDLMTGAKDSVALALTSVVGDAANVALPNESTPFNPLNPPGVMGRGLARWIRYLFDRLPGADQGSHGLVIPLVQLGVPASGSTWGLIEDADGSKIIQSTVGGSEVIRLTLPLPSKGFLKTVHLYVKGGDGTPQHGALPGTKPAVALRRKALIPGSPLLFSESVVATATDGSANVTAYEQAHAISLTGLSVNLDTANPNLDMFLRVTGESGANSVAASFRIFGIGAVVSALP